MNYTCNNVLLFTVYFASKPIKIKRPLHSTGFNFQEYGLFVSLNVKMVIFYLFDVVIEIKNWIGRVCYFGLAVMCFDGYLHKMCVKSTT